MNNVTYFCPNNPPFEINLVTISSMAALDGAHTKILRWLLSVELSMDMIPLIVWVFPVPGGPWISKKSTGFMTETSIKA